MENPGFGFFVNIHLLESLKLELYDLYFRVYSKVMLFSKCGVNLDTVRIILDTILCVDGFYDGSCLRFYFFRKSERLA